MSRPYQRPNLAEQFGLQPDPNKLEHTFHGGINLTKVHTTGGHPIDSDQPGLPVYHRRIANPFPLISLGIGATLLLQGLVQINHRGLTQMNVVMNLLIPYGGIAVITGGMFSFAQGNTFLATLGMTLGGLLGSFGFIFLPWTGIQSSYIVAGITAAGGNTQQGELIGVLALQKAVGIAFFAALIPLFMIFLATLKTAVPVAFGTLLICISLILSGVSSLQYPRIVLQHAAGALNIVVAVTLLYAGVAVLLQEEGIHMPVFALPRHDDD